MRRAGAALVTVLLLAGAFALGLVISRGSGGTSPPAEAKAISAPQGATLRRPARPAPSLQPPRTLAGRPAARGGAGCAGRSRAAGRGIAARASRSRLIRVAGTAIGYVRLVSFPGSATERVDQAVRSLVDRGAKGLILDLRGT